MKCVCELCDWEGRFYEAIYGFDAYTGPKTFWAKFECPSCKEKSKALLFGPNKEDPFLYVIETE